MDARKALSSTDRLPWWIFILGFVITTLFVEVTPTTNLGRNVCARRQYYTRPVHMRQSYRRPVEVKDFSRCAQEGESPCNRTRTTYQQAYRTVVKMVVRTHRFPACCPGWKKNHASDKDCLISQCSKPCMNGGRCVGHETCLCPKGYAGHKCQADIDECTGRHFCQQKCTNLPGSYQCSCSEGFKLADDEKSCELCLSCTTEFQALETKVASLPNTLGREVAKAVKEETLHNQMQADMVAEMRRQEQKFDKLQNQYDSIIELRKKMDVIPRISERVDNLTGLCAMESEVIILDKRLVSLDERLDEGMADIKASHTELGTVMEAEVQKWRDGVMSASITQSSALEALQEQLTRVIARLDAVEMEKEALQLNLTTMASQYEAAVNALQQKVAATTEATTTSSPYGAAQGGGALMPLETLTSLSQQISILEERMSECNCNQHYYG